MNSFDRRPGETVKAHQAFKIYLQLGDERSCAKVAQALSRSRTLITRWSAAHDWQSRTIDYDRDVEQKEHAALIRERISARKRHRQLALLALKQVAAALPMLHPSQFSPGDVARMLECGRAQALETELISLQAHCTEEIQEPAAATKTLQ